MNRIGENYCDSILDMHRHVYRLESAAATLGKVFAGKGCRNDQGGRKQGRRLILP